MSDAVRWLKVWWPWVLVLGALGLVYGPTLAAHIARGFDPYILNDDARQQIYPFFRYADASLFPHDYIGDYYLDCLPLGFRALYATTAPLIDPAVFNKVVTYLMLVVTVSGLGVAANRLGGKVAAWGVMSLALGASLYLDRMAGGLPRAFGFPILAWALVALTYGRTKGLAALVWLGACFYPVTGVVVGLATALLLLVLPASDRGDASEWSLRRRLGFLAVVAGVSVLLLLPTASTSSQYAPVVTTSDLAEYPEAGPGGRYAPNSRAPYGSFFDNASVVMERGLVGTSQWFVPPEGTSRNEATLIFVALFTIVGWLLFVVSSGAARRVVMLGLAAFLGYSIASLVAPYFYLPTRYTTYPMPLLAVLMVGTSVAGFFSVTGKLGGAGRRAAATFVFCVFVLAMLGGPGGTETGFHIKVRNPQLHQAIGELPVDSVIAGWPFTAIENVPYVARRTAFLTFETHQAFHQQYLNVMRERARALIDATLATSDEPLLRLRDEHGVTHMLVYLPHLRGTRLTYFKPFDRWIEEARDEAAGTPLTLRTLVDDHAIYRDGDYAIVDLGALTPPS